MSGLLATFFLAGGPFVQHFGSGFLFLFEVSWQRPRCRGCLKPDLGRFFAAVARCFSEGRQRFGLLTAFCGFVEFTGIHDDLLLSLHFQPQAGVAGSVTNARK
ncbi:MAG: hypothetical protein JO137_19355 [Hyphomicrobiales bacterium]|nr:hypothetical protein [Hyphomicrobiales bacterium]MBV9433988.1 hypothetical protein [Hyphomicrobiales bacterium]